MDKHEELLIELSGLMTGFWLTDFANFSAHFFHNIPNINWIGFYLSDGNKLRLGPFAGKPACVEISYNRGVCGAAFTQKKPILVNDVHEFPDHISCDPASRSEIVLPIKIAEIYVGVLDIDSPLKGRFSNEDVHFFSRALEILLVRIPNFEGLTAD